MISLPLPILAAALCAVIAPLMLRLDLGQRAAPRFFALLFAGLALQALLVGLRFGYGVEDFILFQRLLPLALGPLLYLGFAVLSIPAEGQRRLIAWHLGTALGLAIVLALFADIYRDFDLVIGLSYLVYIVLLLRLFRRGPDALIHARLDQARPALRWMLMGASALAVLLSLDTAIAVSFALGGGSQVTALVSFGSVLLILALIAVLVRLPAPRPTAAASTATRNAQPEEDATRIEAEARAMLRKTRLYLDPDLNVQRLARRLSLPERSLSAAINQSTGQNVSQYVNGFRLEHAAELLRSSDGSVSQVMSQSGFLTRSNFYREFQRVYGQTPAQYRDGAASSS